MDKVFFKIVIPNYNSMAYIRQCLDSILNQTFTDWKCIIIDDLSTDLSDKLAQMYARKYPEHFIFIKADRKSYAGRCRNIGIDFSIKSEYTLFADADDYFYSPTAFKTLYDNLSSRPDILIFNYAIHRGQTANPHKFGKFPINTNRMAQTAYNSAWSKAIASSKVEHFLEDCMRGEDTYMLLNVLDKHPTINQIDDCIYTYRLHGDNSVFSEMFKQHKTKFKTALYNLKKKMTDKFVIESIEHRLGGFKPNED